MFERPQSGRLSPILKHIFIGQPLNQTPRDKVTQHIFFHLNNLFQYYLIITDENISPVDYKPILGMTTMYIEFDQLEIDLRIVCTLTAVYCMFTHVEAYCLLKIFLSETNISLASAK